VDKILISLLNSTDDDDLIFLKKIKKSLFIIRNVENKNKFKFKFNFKNKFKGLCSLFFVFGNEIIVLHVLSASVDNNV
jgi:hypothetical protein